MRIGELAAQAGISTKAIRYYERIGVLAFARYSQAADLANGVAWYATLGVSTALLTLTAATAGLAGGPPTTAAAALWAAISATVAHSAATAGFAYTGSNPVPATTSELRKRALRGARARLLAGSGFPPTSLQPTR